MEQNHAKRVSNPLLHDEKVALAERQTSGRPTRSYLLSRIEYYEQRTRELVKTDVVSEEQGQVEWQQSYKALDYLYDELSKAPLENPEAGKLDEIDDIESLEQLNALYADATAQFPRLSKRAVETAFRLLSETTLLGYFVLVPGDDKDALTINNALQQIPNHRKDTFHGSDRLRGPVIHQDEDGNYTHYRFGVEIRQRQEHSV